MDKNPPIKSKTTSELVSNMSNGFWAIRLLNKYSKTSHPSPIKNTKKSIGATDLKDKESNFDKKK